MIELVSVPALLARPRCMDAAWIWTGTFWSREEDVALLALCNAQAPLERSADGLGRSPTSIAHRASDTGLRLPPEWRSAISKRRPRKEAAPRIALAYPYITDVRGEHAELLAVNALVPHGLPDHMRADVCQEIMLAIWQGKTSVAELQSDRALVGKFIKSIRVLNYEDRGFALSLDAPMADGRSWYDILPGDQGAHQ